jgi:SAM-dependent methyltransferase
LTQLTPVLGIAPRATGQSEGTSLVDRSTTTAKPVNRCERWSAVSTPPVGGHCGSHVCVNGRTTPPPEGRSSRPPHDFDAIYAAGTAAWDIGRPQPAFEHLAAAGELVGRVLDVGCGTGEHALMAALLGYETVGIDMSTRAVELARTKGVERGVEARFVVADALRLADLGEQFDTVLDCGLFHVLDDGERERFVASLAEVIPPGGRYHMLCFSDRQPGDWGPRRVTQDEIRVAFSVGWRIESIESAVIDITWDPAGAMAWQVAAARR